MLIHKVHADSSLNSDLLFFMNMATIFSIIMYATVTILHMQKSKNNIVFTFFSMNNKKRMTLIQLVIYIAFLLNAIFEIVCRLCKLILKGCYFKIFYRKLPWTEVIWNRWDFYLGVLLYTSQIRMMHNTALSKRWLTGCSRIVSETFLFLNFIINKAIFVIMKKEGTFKKCLN